MKLRVLNDEVSGLLDIQKTLKTSIEKLSTVLDSVDEIAKAIKKPEKEIDVKDVVEKIKQVEKLTAKLGDDL